MSVIVGLFSGVEVSSEDHQRFKFINVNSNSMWIQKTIGKNTGYFNYIAVASISPLPSGFWLVSSVEFAASKLTF